MRVEQFHQLCEIRQRPGQPINLVDHHDVDPAGPEIGQQALQGGSIEGGTRKAAVIIVVRDQTPALMGLALDVGLAGLPLGIERVEFEVEVMLGRFASIDRAAEDLSVGCHGCAFLDDREPARRGDRSGSAAGPLCPSGSLTRVRSPKNLGPFQAVPVMARAMVERLA